MSKERDIQILEFEIAKLEDLIYEYQEHDIPQIKTDKLIAKKTRYEAHLATVLAS